MGQKFQAQTRRRQPGGVSRSEEVPSHFFAEALKGADDLDSLRSRESRSLKEFTGITANLQLYPVNVCTRTRGHWRGLQGLGVRMV